MNHKEAWMDEVFLPAGRELKEDPKLENNAFVLVRNKFKQLNSILKKCFGGYSNYIDLALRKVSFAKAR